MSFSEPVSFTWAPRGKTPLLKRIGKYRRQVSTMAALTISGKIYKRHFAGSINSEKLIVGLDHLRQHIRGPFIIIYVSTNRVTASRRGTRRFGYPIVRTFKA